MTQVPAGSHLRTYFSIEIMRICQGHPNIRKFLCILTIPKSKTNLALKMTMTPKNLRKPRPDGPVVWRLCYIIGAGVESTLQSCVLAFHLW